MNSQGYSYDNLDYYRKQAEFLAQGIAGPLCAYWSVQEVLMCGHGSCYAIVAELEELPDNEGDRYPEHDCPKDHFLEDPITQAYGVGGEMLHLISCKICDARDD